MNDTILLPPNGRLDFVQTFFSDEQADRYFSCFSERIRWQQDSIKIHGKTLPIPRLQAWYGDPQAAYTYSGLTMQPQAFFDELTQVRTALCDWASATLGQAIQFNSVLCNLYRDGQDSVSWHSDDEPELGRDPVIASVSLGGMRTFSLQHKKNKAQKSRLVLPHNSVLLMSGDLQHFWRHQVAKTAKACAPRINLTFRWIQ